MKTETRTVSPRRTFRDGQFKTELEALGYPCELEAGLKVTLPISLIKRMEAASAQFTEAAPDAQEAFIIPKYHAPANAQQIKRARLEAQYANEKRVECLCIRGSHDVPFCDGDIILEMAVAGYPLAFYLDEVRLLPVSLVRHLLDAGHVTIDPSRIHEAKTGIYVAQYGGHVEAWRESQIAIAAQAAEDAKPKPPQLSPLAQEVLHELDNYYQAVK